jgi:hypothetical protein
MPAFAGDRTLKNQGESQAIPVRSKLPFCSMEAFAGPEVALAAAEVGLTGAPPAVPGMIELKMDSKTSRT